MSANNENHKVTVTHLLEIRKACAVATSTVDTNVNLIIEEIDRLVKLVLVSLSHQ